MRVAKRFRWEGAHRLADHPGLCRSLHGHSYAMTVEVEGGLADGTMVLDFHALKRLAAPLVDAFDHATLVDAADEQLRTLLDDAAFKQAVLPYPTTSENVARFAADYLCHAGEAALRAAGVRAVSVRLQETETCYAVYERPLDPARAPLAPTDPAAFHALLGPSAHVPR